MSTGSPFHFLHTVSLSEPFFCGAIEDSARQGVVAAFLETGGQTQHLCLIAAGRGADGNDLELAFGQGHPFAPWWWDRIKLSWCVA
jgi:hypothetical protein